MYQPMIHLWPSPETMQRARDSEGASGQAAREQLRRLRGQRKRLRRASPKPIVPREPLALRRKKVMAHGTRARLSAFKALLRWYRQAGLGRR